MSLTACTKDFLVYVPHLRPYWRGSPRMGGGVDWDLHSEECLVTTMLRSKRGDEHEDSMSAFVFLVLHTCTLYSAYTRVTIVGMR